MALRTVWLLIAILTLGTIALQASGKISGSLGWVLAVNLVIWTGLFYFLLRIQSKISSLENPS